MTNPLQSREYRWLYIDFGVRVIGLMWWVIGRSIARIPAIAEARQEGGSFLCFVSFFATILGVVGFGLVIVGQRGIETWFTPRKPRPQSSIQ